MDELSPGDLEGFITGMTRNEAVDALAEMGFAVGPIYSVKDIINDPHLKARKTLVEVEHPKVGRITTPTYPVKYSESPAGA
jgi:crotonobetainyl-CoA:carnitine CoA-transferase CaiB-like acyl-CoA transferase